MSIWADIQDRSVGILEKREDDVNLLDSDGLVQYLKGHYENFNSHLKHIPLSSSYIKIDDFVEYVRVAVFKPTVQGLDNFLFIDTREQGPSVNFSWNISDRYEQYIDIVRTLKEKFKVTIEGIGDLRHHTITPQEDDKITHKFFLEVIDYLIENGPKNLIIIKKKEL